MRVALAVLLPFYVLAVADAQSNAPTRSPIQLSTKEPTGLRTKEPTGLSTKAPTNTAAPTTQFPTVAPMQAPTDPPTWAPTAPSTGAPNDAPTRAPTRAPSDPPTLAPSDPPTQAPTDPPTDQPTKSPTEIPTNSPTLQLSSVPSSVPTPSGVEIIPPSPPSSIEKPPDKAPPSGESNGTAPLVTTLVVLAVVCTTLVLGVFAFVKIRGRNRLRGDDISFNEGRVRSDGDDDGSQNSKREYNMYPLDIRNVSGLSPSQSDYAFSLEDGIPNSKASGRGKSESRSFDYSLPKSDAGSSVGDTPRSENSSGGEKSTVASSSAGDSGTKGSQSSYTAGSNSVVTSDSNSYSTLNYTVDDTTYSGDRSKTTKSDSDILFEVSESSSSSVTQDGSLVGSANMSVEEGETVTEETGDFSYVTPTNMSARECLVPPGKIGISIETVSGGPVVTQVKPGSPLEGLAYAGDRIVAIDEVDTRGMTAVDLTKIVMERVHRQRTLILVSPS